jgi:nucleolar protein 56
MFVLFETASGYSLFERMESEEIGQQLEEYQKEVTDLGKFGKTVKLVSFLPFKSAVHALENINDISEGIVNETLKNFLEVNLPKTSKKTSKVVLGVSEKTLAGSIKQELGIECSSGELVQELIRGIRFHAEKLLKQFKEGDLEKAQLGLGHSYSRAKVKFNVNRADNMIIQAIALLDQLDKDINTFSMRIREWYSWHFPELVKLVSDHNMYAQLAKAIGDKSKIDSEKKEVIEKIVEDSEKAADIVNAANASMGTDISEVDLLNINLFANRVIDLYAYRKQLYEYLLSKMHNIAPNLSALIGEVVGARLIAHAGSLTNLSKYPASTVQILGAEKALFRALKTRGKTPKYGLIFHSSFIGKAALKNKGRVSRYLANKCSIASRIDCFSETPTSKFGEALKEQVEERLSFYDTGVIPRKNVDVMDDVLKSINVTVEQKVDKKEKKEKKEKNKEEKSEKKDKKEKSEKKEKSGKKEKSEKKEKSDKKEKKKRACDEDDEKPKKKSKE